MNMQSGRSPEPTGRGSRLAVVAIPIPRACFERGKITRRGVQTAPQFRPLVIGETNLPIAAHDRHSYGIEANPSSKRSTTPRRRVRSEDGAGMGVPRC
jgi:hypothetical protein